MSRRLGIYLPEPRWVYEFQKDGCKSYLDRCGVILLDESFIQRLHPKELSDLNDQALKEVIDRSRSANWKKNAFDGQPLPNSSPELRMFAQDLRDENPEWDDQHFIDVLRERLFLLNFIIESNDYGAALKEIRLWAFDYYLKYPLAFEIIRRFTDDETAAAAFELTSNPETFDLAQFKSLIIAAENADHPLIGAVSAWLLNDSRAEDQETTRAYEKTMAAATKWKLYRRVAKLNYDPPEPDIRDNTGILDEGFVDAIEDLRNRFSRDPAQLMIEGTGGLVYKRVLATLRNDLLDEVRRHERTKASLPTIEIDIPNCLEHDYQEVEDREFFSLLIEQRRAEIHKEIEARYNGRRPDKFKAIFDSYLRLIAINSENPSIEDILRDLNDHGVELSYDTVKYFHRENKKLMLRSGIIFE